MRLLIVEEDKKFAGFINKGCLRNKIDKGFYAEADPNSRRNGLCFGDLGS